MPTFQTSDLSPEDREKLDLITVTEPIDLDNLDVSAVDLEYLASSADGIVRADGGGTDATIPLADGTDAGLMSPADKNKLDAIQALATANSTDAQLRDRSTHTGTQLAATISDFAATASAAAPVQSVASKTGAVTLVKGDVGLGNVDNTADADKPVSTATQTALDLKQNALGYTAENTANKGAANGYAALGSDGKVPSSQLPADGSYQGTWNADTNTPTIVSSTGTSGDFYFVSTAGTTTIDGISSWAVGDQVRFNGSVWEKIPSSSAVSSVAGKTGAVTLEAADVGLGNVTNVAQAPASRTITAGTGLTGGGDLTTNRTLAVSFGTTAGTACEGNDSRLSDARTPTTHTHTASDVTDFTSAAAAAAPVASVAGRTGAVTLSVGDVSGAAPLASPTLTGTPSAPTPATSDSTTKIATTAYVKNQGYVTSSGVTAVNVTAPITTTGGATPTIAISPATTSTAGSMSANDKTKLDGVQWGAQPNAVTSVAGRTGAITLAVADVSGAAPLAGPALTGVPTAPTASTSDSSTQIATTAFVKAQNYLTSAVTSVSGTAPIVSSGGATPAISISAATTGAAGSMSAADKTKLDYITVTDDVTLDRLADAIYVTDYMDDMEDDLGAALVQAQLEAYNTATRLRTTSWATPSSIVKSDTTVTVTSSTHLLSTNDIVVLRGANESLYNDERGFEVTRIDANSFSFQVLSGDPDPTGTIEWRSYGGTSIGRLINRPIVIPPGQYKMRTVAELTNASAMTVDIWGYGAVIRQAPEFPTGRCMIEMGIPSGAEPFDANDWYTSQPFFATIRGVTFRDFDYALQMGYASCNVNLGRMALIDCDFFGNIYSTSEAVRAFNRSASLHIVRCQFDHVAVGVEAQSIDRVYIDHPRMQIKEYPASADRPTLSGKFVLRRGIMRVTNAILNPPLDDIEDEFDKPIGWFLTSEFDEWQPTTTYRRGDLVLADGEEEDLPVASAVKSGTTVTITITDGHNVRVHEKIMLIGAGVDYDDTWFEVASVTSGTVFTIEVDSGLANPSGTITYRRLQLWVCNTGNGGVTDPGNHTSAADFMTDKATNWILVDQAMEGPLSVWVDLFIDKCLFGGESGGITPVIWNAWEDNGVSRKSGSSTNTVTYHRTVRLHDCLIGTNAQNGTRAFNMSGGAYTEPTTVAYSSGVATWTTAAAHGLRTNDVIDVEQAEPDTYDGQFRVTVIDSTSFSFEPATDPGSVVTGDSNLLAPSSIVSTGTTATVTTAAPHGLSSGKYVTISGCAETEYNGRFPITVTGASEFQYTMSGDPADTATGLTIRWAVGPRFRKSVRVSPAVLLVKVPNRIEVTGCKFSATGSVAADFWGEQDAPEIWLPTRFRPLECISRDNHGGSQSNIFTSGGLWRDVSVNYVPSDIIAPTYTHTSGFGMYIPTNARVVKTSFSTEQDIYAFFNISNGQEFTLICDTNTDIYNNTGSIKLASTGTFAPGANGGAISFVVVDGCAYETGRVTY